MEPKEIALAHFEKAVLAGFAGWLVMTLVGFVSAPDSVALKTEIDDKVKKIEAHMKGASQPEPKDPGWQKQLAAQLASDTVPQPKPLIPWLTHKRPGFLRQEVSNTIAIVAKHSAPTDLTPDGAVRGKVTLKWKAGGENEYVICTYDVLRKVGEKGTWETVGKTNPGVTEYVDSKVGPRQQYYYKVVSIAAADQDNPVVQKINLTVPEELSRRESSEVGPVATARDIYVIPQTITEVTDEILIQNPNAKEQAYVKVFKWDPATGQFQKKNFNVPAGGKIGGVEKIRVGGKSVDFDFGTGAVLDDVWNEKKKTDQRVETIQWVKIKYADGTTEEFNDRKADRPADLGE